MADKLTLLELHLHANDNEFKSDMQLSSDIGDLLRRRLGLGSGSDEETEESEESDLGEELKAEVDERTPIEATANGGDTVQVDEAEGEEEEQGGAVVEIDADTDVEEEEDEDDESGASMGEMLLFAILLGIGLVFVARRYVGVDELEDEFEDEFEEL